LGTFIFGQNPYGDMRALGRRHEGRRATPEYRETRAPSGFPERTLDKDEPDGSSAFETYEVDGLAEGYFNAPGQRLTDENLDQLRAVPQRGMWWYFDGSARYVSKAVRIPVVYTITDNSGQNARTVQDYLIVGFEGAGW
jgi:hypothetical protein